MQQGAPPANFRMKGASRGATLGASAGCTSEEETRAAPRGGRGEERRGFSPASERRRPTGKQGSPRPRTTFPGKPRGPQLTHFPARHGLARPPRPGGCSLLTGVWAGSGGGRRQSWPPQFAAAAGRLGRAPRGSCGRHGRAGGARRLLQQQPSGSWRC